MKKYVVLLIGILIIIISVISGVILIEWINYSKYREEPINTIALDNLARDIFNSRLEIYKSSKLSGKRVILLFDEVENLYTQNVTPDKIEISFLFDGKEDSIEEESHYSVDFEYSKETGYIEKVIIDQVMSAEQSGESNE